MQRRIPRSAAIPLIIFVGVEATCLLAFGCSGAFLAESTFFLAALVVTVIEIARTTDSRSVLFGLPAALVAGVFFALQGTLCIAAAALRDSSMPYVAVTSTALFAFEAVAFIAGSDAEAHVAHVEKSTSKETAFIDDVRLKLSTLAIEAQGETKDIVEKVTEEARFANPRSTPATREVDHHIETEVENLNDAIQRNDLKKTKMVAASLTALFKQRSEICKQAVQSHTTQASSDTGRSRWATSFRK